MHNEASARSRPQPDGFWLMTAAASLWGTIGIATQAIYHTETTTSLFINLGRMLIATPILFVICWFTVGRRMFAVPRRDAGVMFLSGALLATSHAAYFAGIRHAGVIIPTLLAICLTPMIVAAAALVLRIERLSTRLLTALVCALLGTFLLVGAQADAGFGGDNLVLGSLFGALAGATYGGVILCGRLLARDYHPLQVTALTFAAGTGVLLVVNVLVGIQPVTTAQSWLLLTYLGLVPSALAYWLFQVGLRAVPATAASIITMLEPLVATMLAWALFGERLALLGVFGALLLIGSIVLLSTGRGG